MTTDRKDEQKESISNKANTNECCIQELCSRPDKTPLTVLALIYSARIGHSSEPVKSPAAECNAPEIEDRQLLPHQQRGPMTKDTKEKPQAPDY